MSNPAPASPISFPATPIAERVDLGPCERIMSEFRPTVVESARERELTEMVEFIADFCNDPSDLPLLRRAVRNIYKLGVLHEVQDQCARMEQTRVQMVHGS